jgi:phosphate transport system substrate-binding protein
MKKLVCVLFSTALLTGVVSAQVLINGAGATFPYPVYSKWFNQYHQKFSNAQINYQSQGSGAGIRQVTEGTVDFGATDGPMNEDQLKQFRSKRGSEILHFPTVMGADVIVYNLAGVSKELNFTPEAIAGIFLGRIKKWNDPELAKSNPGVNLPGSDIVVVHRSDGSGTTYVFVDYLSKVSKEWETKVGRGTSVNWPVGLGGKGNEGVAGQIKQTPNSIGYIELIYAIQNKMAYGNVKNTAGKFIRPDTASVTAAAAGALKEMPEDFRVSITDAPGKESYPISSFTWLLIPARIQDQSKKKALVDFLRWMLDNDAQSTAEALNYARLPKAVVAKEIKAISKIQ